MSAARTSAPPAWWAGRVWPWPAALTLAAILAAGYAAVADAGAWRAAGEAGLWQALALLPVAAGLSLALAAMGWRRFIPGALMPAAALAGAATAILARSVWVAGLTLPAYAAACGVMVALAAAVLAAWASSRWRTRQEKRLRLANAAAALAAFAAVERYLAYWGGGGRLDIAASEWLFALTPAAPPGAVVLVAGGCLAALLWIWLAASRRGRILRAAAEDPQLARRMGWPSAMARLAALGLGALLIFAGALAWVQPQFQAETAGLPAGHLVLSVGAVVLGSVGAFGGAVLGALILGLAFAYGEAALPGGGLAAALTVLVAALMWRPDGFVRPRRRGR